MLILDGVIAATGFASGDRVVIGSWWSSPLGAFTDVMWSEPGGVRVLYAPDDRVARFVTSVYRFDRLVVAPFSTRVDDRRVEVEVAGRRVLLEGGRRLPLPFPGGRRPRWITRWVEGPIARSALGVRTFGTSPTGVREWYQARHVRWVRAASGSVAGRDLGALTPVWPPVGVGFSEPPRRPSIVRVRTTLLDPTGRVDRVVGAPARPRPSGA